MTDHGGLFSAARMIDVTVDFRGPLGWSHGDARGSDSTSASVRRDRERDGGCSISARTPAVRDAGPALGVRVSATSWHH